MTVLAVDNEIQSFLGGVSGKRKKIRPRAGRRDCEKLCVSRNESLGLGHSLGKTILKERIHLGFWRGLLWAQGQKARAAYRRLVGALLCSLSRQAQPGTLRTA